jgi:fumarate reductase subunit C
MSTKEYIRPMPATWWLRNHHLTLFMIRELTSLFVAGYTVFLMVMLYRYHQGGNHWTEFFETLGRPESIILQLIALIFVVFHSITWFNLTPQIVIVWRGEDKVSPLAIAGGHYALWLIVSIIVWWVAVG